MAYEENIRSLLYLVTGVLWSVNKLISKSGLNFVVCQRRMPSKMRRPLMDVLLNELQP